MPGRLTPNTFITRARKIHGNVYDYSHIDYVHSQEKLTIVCKKHGPFKQRPQKHLNGQGCPICRFDKSAAKNRLTKEEFVNNARKIWGEKFNYDKVNYLNNHTKIVISCPVHGDFSMLPSNHTNKNIPQGCPQCGGKKPWNSSMFFEEANKLHGNKYSYFKTVFKSMTSRVIIICPIHGDFVQKPIKHLAGQGCPHCAGTIKLSKEEFVNNARKIWGEKFNYDKVNYLNNHTKIVISCPVHGDFSMLPSNHTNKNLPQGCPRCSGRSPLTTEEFVMLASEKHDNLYNYSKFVYKGSQTPSTIICPYHGPFAQKPSVHLSGSGCPRCRAPRGENRIEQVLKHINIEYEKQFSFSDCRHVLPLHFDFALFFDRRIAIIEYNGEQHYRKISYKQSHDAYGYDDIVLRDSIKKEYCSSNEIPLLVISYEQFDIIDSLVRQFVDKLSKTQ